MLAISFPSIDPILFTFHNLEIRWYGIAYAISILLGYFLFIKLNSMHSTNMRLKKEIVDDIPIYVMIGIIAGGRLGYTLFYHTSWILEEPITIFKIWQGGMSFHGGGVGVAVALYILSIRSRCRLLVVTDLVACVTPIGLFLGRVANFINAELYGRATQAGWGVIFPGTDGVSRHPSQLYEAATEGILMFVVMLGLYLLTKIKNRSGTLTAVFMILYGVCRIIIELFREPDAHIGTFLYGTTMGQLLSIPMILIGTLLLLFSKYEYSGNANNFGSRTS